MTWESVTSPLAGEVGGVQGIKAAGWGALGVIPPHLLGRSRRRRGWGRSC